MKKCKKEEDSMLVTCIRYTKLIMVTATILVLIGIEAINMGIHVIGFALISLAVIVGIASYIFYRFLKKKL